MAALKRMHQLERDAAESEADAEEKEHAGKLQRSLDEEHTSMLKETHQEFLGKVRASKDVHVVSCHCDWEVFCILVSKIQSCRGIRKIGMTYPDFPTYQQCFFMHCDICTRQHIFNIQISFEVNVFK